MIVKEIMLNIIKLPINTIKNLINIKHKILILILIFEIFVLISFYFNIRFFIKIYKITNVNYYNKLKSLKYKLI